MLFFTPILGVFGHTLMERIVGSLLTVVLPIALLIILIFVIVRLSARKNAKDMRQKTAAWLSEDEMANHAKAHDISEDYFFSPDISKLPLAEYSIEQTKSHGPAIWQKKVLDISGKKMLRFERQMSNIELKQAFGQSNLEFVATYEENFTSYTHAMRHWAQALLSNGQKSDAALVLCQAIAARVESSAVYTLLADLYAENNDTQALQQLKADTANLPEAGRNIAIKHIDSLLGGK